MGATINRNYPFPGGADVFNTAVDIQALADALDLDVEAVEAAAVAALAAAAGASAALVAARSFAYHEKWRD